MGYGGSIKDAGKAMGKSGDEGIDGTIKEDKLGLDIIYIQAKRWKPGNVVGRPEIQKFVGALAGQGAKKGIFITTSSFTNEANFSLPFVWKWFALSLSFKFIFTSAANTEPTSEAINRQFFNILNSLVFIWRHHNNSKWVRSEFFYIF